MSENDDKSAFFTTRRTTPKAKAAEPKKCGTLAQCVQGDEVTLEVGGESYTAVVSTTFKDGTALVRIGDAGPREFAGTTPIIWQRVRPKGN